MQPHDFWQAIHPPASFESHPADGHRGFYPAEFEDGRQLCLPIRELADGEHALASLIINQASFAVEEALCEGLAEKVRCFEPEVVVGLPTLGLTLASGTAKKLGLSRYVPLGTSRKFWYREELSVPMTSITSPEQSKRLYIDPRMLPLIENRRVLLVDDVISSGRSISAALKLLASCGICPVAIGVAMVQTMAWKEKLAALDPRWPERVVGVLRTPRLRRTAAGGWSPE
ncbi:adenine/guanine phosphoribosyltransferase-like PRPP-binding protein [Microvirga flocculans]|uniref:Adenine/guanine phosphoribosyltransferase-like PRPP-binding protein n=1 Tax=Microvirga flocculans TaxID=217168 RepID=A0A7W6IHM9_9HYPH|nr:phosphoribosyltransferase [Microvirga flocculans]MBB4041514.1 adenine/guanine phosphoribosyltransferase-like PRPP-binding protein [Microvirga flocculans]